MSKAKLWLINILKWSGKILITLLLLLIILVFALRLPFVQTFITNKALGFYSEKVQTPAKLGGLYLDFPTTLVIRDLYVEGQERDTLVHLNRLGVSANILGLFSNRLQIEDVSISGLTGHVKRDETGTFNFQYILDAFSGEPTESTSDPMKISVEDVGLTDARVSYRDQYTGIDITANIGDLQVAADVFDLDEPLISIEYLLLQDTQAELRLYNGSYVPEESSEENDADSRPFRIEGKFAELQRVKFKMDEEVGGLTLTSELENLQLEIDTLDINNQVYIAKKINLQQPMVSLEFRNIAQDSTFTPLEPLDSTTSKLKLIAGSRVINLNGGRFRLWDHSEAEQIGFDPSHMWFDNLNLKTGEVRYENENVFANIESVTGTDLRNRKELKSFHGELVYSDSLTYAHSLEAVFEDSRVEGEISLRYSGLDDLLSFGDKVRFQVQLDNTEVHPADVNFFIPGIEILQELQTSPVGITGNVHGSLSDFTIDRLTADWGQEHISIPSLSAQKVLEFPNSEVKAFGLAIRATPRLFSVFSADSVMAPFDLPAQMDLSADLFYAYDSMVTAAVFNSSDGNFTLSGSGKLDLDSAINFTLDLGLDELQAGKILRQPDLGRASLTLVTSGKGKDISDLTADVNLKLNELGYREYVYSGLEITGLIDHESFDGEITYSDENLELDFTGLLSLGEGQMRQDFDLKVSRADLRALNLSKDEFRVLGNLRTDVTIDEDMDLTGMAVLTGLGVNRSGDRYDLDTLLLTANNSDGNRDISLDSDFVEAVLHATFPIPEIPAVINSYYEGFVSDSSNTNSLEGKSFTANMRIKDTDILTEVLVPDLEYLEVSPVQVTFDGSTQQMTAEAHLDSVKYGTFMVNDLNLQLGGDQGDLHGSVDWDALRSGPLYIENFLARMQSQQRGIKVNVQVRDQVDTLRYNLSTLITQNSDAQYELNIHPDSVMLNYSEWTIPDSNSVTFGGGRFWIKDLELRQEYQAITLHSELNNPQDTLLVFAAENFELSELASLARDTIPTLSGILHGNLDVDISNSGFEADVDISDLVVKGFEVGNFNLYSEKSSADSYTANFQISGQGNDLKFDGKYKTDGALEANLAIKNLNLDPIEAVSAGNLTDLDGVVRGDFAVTGTLTDPELNGDLVFDNVSFIVDMVQEKFTLYNEQLSVTNNAFRFNNFTLKDTRDRKATVNGQVSTDDFVEYDLGLNIVTEEFTLLNSKEGDNELFYGKVSATSKLDLKGTNLNPSVNLNLTLSDDSRVTYVIPESTISAQVQSDVVVFVDKDEENTDFLGKKTARDSLRKNVLGMNLDAVVNVPQKAELKIVVDPLTGDALTVRGSALLNLGIRPAGDITLTGRYEVKQGSYHMDFYGLVQRDFEIQEGSYILWTGNIYEALLNITAVYKTRARPVLTNNTERLDFVVQLILMGQLLQPEISFKIDLDEGAPAPIEVQSWIAQLNQDKAQLNKQAFGLLIFNAFFDDTGQSGNWYDNLAQNTARSSVSSFLSAELNRLSDKIEGIELTFDLSSYEDYNSQGDNIGRTQLELGLSKQFFDNRLIVKFAGNFDLEGQNAYRDNVSDFTGDLRVEYLLTEDGRYRLVGFRETNYDDLLQGEIIRTGGGFIFVRDYDSLRELFNKPKRKNEKE